MNDIKHTHLLLSLALGAMLFATLATADESVVEHAPPSADEISKSNKNSCAIK